MEQFNQLDLVIALALVVGAINGFFRGFISQLIGLFGFFIAIWPVLNSINLLKYLLMNKI